MDDTYLQGNSFVSCQQNIYATVTLLQDLGFNINQKKYVLIPTQNLEFLGFLLDSHLMTITLTARRKADILEVCSNLLKHNRPKIQFVSTVIGMVIAALPGVQHGALHYRILESEKTATLRQNAGDYNKRMTLSPLATVEIQWWLTNINSSCHFIHAPRQILSYTQMLVWMGGELQIPWPL